MQAHWAAGTMGHKETEYQPEVQQYADRLFLAVSINTSTVVVVLSLPSQYLEIKPFDTSIELRSCKFINYIMVTIAHNNRAV